MGDCVLPYIHACPRPLPPSRPPYKANSVTLLPHVTPHLTPQVHELGTGRKRRQRSVPREECRDLCRRRHRGRREAGECSDLDLHHRENSDTGHSEWGALDLIVWV